MWLHKTIICPIHNKNDDNNAADPTCHNRDQHNTNLWQVLLPQHRLHHSPAIWTSIMNRVSGWMDADGLEGFWKGILGTGSPTKHSTYMEDEQHSACRDIQWSRLAHKKKGWHKPRCITKGRLAPAVSSSKRGFHHSPT